MPTTVPAPVFSATVISPAAIIGAVVSTVTTSADEGADTLPAASVILAVSDTSPSATGDVVVNEMASLVTSLLLTVPEAITPDASDTSTRSPSITAVPSSAEVLKLTSIVSVVALVMSSESDTPKSTLDCKSTPVGAAAATLSTASACAVTTSSIDVAVSITATVS